MCIPYQVDLVFYKKFTRVNIETILEDEAWHQKFFNNTSTSQ